MSHFFKVLTCLFFVFFCKESEAQLFRRSRNFLPACNSIGPCEYQSTTTSQAQTPTFSCNDQNSGCVEIIEIDGAQSPWETEGGRGAPIVDAPLDGGFAGDVISVIQQTPVTEGDGVYPLPTIQSYVLDNEVVPVHGFVDSQIENFTESQLTYPAFDVGSAPLPFSNEQSFSNEITPPELHFESGYFSGVEQVAFESSEADGAPQVLSVESSNALVVEPATETATVAPLEVDAIAPGPALVPQQPKPSVSVLELE